MTRLPENENSQVKKEKRKKEFLLEKEIKEMKEFNLS